MVMAMHGCILSEIQAPAEKRQVFANELQRVGNEGAKVSRELGRMVEKMERLSSEDILVEVHQAAEELQLKIDRNSYILMNFESWEVAGLQRKEIEERQNDIEPKDDGGIVINSLNETFGGQQSLGSFSINTPVPTFTSTDSIFKQQPVSWPRLSFTGGSVLAEPKSKVYKSASSLSLATFMSLLIEFVARLENIVEEFQELSEVANFKEPTDQPEEKVTVGFWSRFGRCFHSY